jgi:hypothetical protein
MTYVRAVERFLGMYESAQQVECDFCAYVFLPRGKCESLHRRRVSARFMNLD